MSENVVIFGPYPPPYGGVSIFGSQLFSLLEQAGARPILKIAGIHKEMPGQCVKPNTRSVIKHFAALERGAKIIDSSIYFVEYPQFLRTLAFLAVKKLKGLEWIKIIHDGTLPERFQQLSPLQRLAARLSLKFADKVVPVGTGLGAWLDTEFKLADPVTVISSLLPVEQAEKKHILPIVKEQKLDQFDALVCSIGAFTDLYGFDDIAIAVERLRSETGQNIGLVLVDGGFTQDENYRSQVLFRGDWIIPLEELPHRALLGLYDESDVFVRATSSESYGLSRVEALLNGLPVVATPIGETRGMLLYEPGDINGLSSQIRKALSTDTSSDIARWVLHYRDEAEHNQDAWLAMIIGNSAQSRP